MIAIILGIAIIAIAFGLLKEGIGWLIVGIASKLAKFGNKNDY